MRFRLVENILDEDFEVAPGITFRDLMKAAEDGNGDFILNPPGVDGVINLKEEQWDRLYDELFNTDVDTQYETFDDYQKEKNMIYAFSRRYNCV